MSHQHAESSSLRIDSGNILNQVYNTNEETPASDDDSTPYAGDLAAPPHPRGAAADHPSVVVEEDAPTPLAGRLAAPPNQEGRLRAPVDAFFDKVMVNSDVAEERDNRLKLLGQVRSVMGRVADFGMVGG